VDVDTEGKKKRIMEFLNKGNDSCEVQSECDIGDDGRIISSLPEGYWSVVLKGFSYVPKASKNLRILVIGLGGGIVPNHIHNVIKPHFLKKGIKVTIDIVEYDEIVIEAYKRFFTNIDLFVKDSVTRNKKGDFNIHSNNGVEYVKEVSKAIDMRYDMIFVDAFTGDGNLDAFMEDDFFENARTALTENGVLIYNSHLQKRIAVKKGMDHVAKLETKIYLTKDDSNAVLIGRKGDEKGDLGLDLPEQTKIAIQISTPVMVETRGGLNKRLREALSAVENCTCYEHKAVTTRATKRKRTPP
jgi:hypothetical protein